MTDRRVRRTRERLRRALVELTLEKGYGAVTVQDVLERADVARATFYAHFRDKDDLLVSGFDELREQLRRYVAERERHGTHGLDGEPRAAGDGGAGVAGGVGLRWLFEHVGSNRALWQALAGWRGGGAGAMVVRRARGEIEALLREHLLDVLAKHGQGRTGGRARPEPGVRGGPGVPVEVAVCYVVSALVGLLTWWLDDDSAFGTYSAGELHDHFMRLTEPAIGLVLALEGSDLAGGLAERRPRD